VIRDAFFLLLGGALAALLIRRHANRLAAELHASETRLRNAIDSSRQKAAEKKGDLMTNPILARLEAQVKATKDAEDSATVLINGFADRLDAAVALALANGATEAELAPIQAELDAMKASTDALAAAVVAGTPSAPAPEPTP
jgi:hypothetical protein